MSLTEPIKKVEDKKEEVKQLHVDEFIDWGYGLGNDLELPELEKRAERYARFFFHLHRLPATLQMAFSEQLASIKLFCDFEGKRYRVTGASRMGDVWLHSNFKQDTGYEKRITVNSCSNWSDSPDKVYSGSSI